MHIESPMELTCPDVDLYVALIEYAFLKKVNCAVRITFIYQNTYLCHCNVQQTIRYSWSESKQ